MDQDWFPTRVTAANEKCTKQGTRCGLKLKKMMFIYATADYSYKSSLI